MKYLLIILACICLISCEKTKDYYIKVDNNSDKIICFHANLEYPDDSMLVRHCRIDQLPVSIQPHSSRRYISGINGRVQSWYNAFRQSDVYGGYVSVYISEMDIELIESYEQKQDNDSFVDLPIIARYDLKREDIEALDWVVTYPPSPEMKNIHMWPRYDQYDE
jgi:hypothetical protein